MELNNDKTYTITIEYKALPGSQLEDYTMKASGSWSFIDNETTNGKDQLVFTTKKVILEDENGVKFEELIDLAQVANMNIVELAQNKLIIEDSELSHSDKTFLQGAGRYVYE